MLVTHKKIVTIVLLLLRKKALKTLHSKISDVNSLLCWSSLFLQELSQYII